MRQKANGWLALGFNYNGAMITSECVMVFNNGSDVFGVRALYVQELVLNKSINWRFEQKFFLRNTTEQLATWNDDSLISWDMTETSREVDGDYTVFNFTRPLDSGKLLHH